MHIASVVPGRGILALVGMLVVMPKEEPASVGAPRLELGVAEPTSVRRARGRYPGFCRQVNDNFGVSAHSVATQSFDADGRVQRATLDQDDRRVSWFDYEYDSRGHVIRETFHHLDFDGVEDITGITTYVHDRFGREIERVSDYRGDGRPDALRIKSYDHQGRLTATRWDVDPRSRRGGTRTSYTYDGWRLVFERHDDDDGRPEYYVRYTHDERGFVVEAESQWYRHASWHRNPRFLHRFTYDGDGRTLTRHVIAGLWERDDETDVYRYDDGGNLVDLERRRRDGTVVTRYTNHYDCW